MGDLIELHSRRRNRIGEVARAEGYMTKRQVAVFLGVSTRTVERYAADDGLPFYRVRGRNLYRRSEIDNWVACLPPRAT